MRIFKIRKRSGAYRTIYAPDQKEKAELKKLLPYISKCAEAGNNYGVQHGFQPRRSAVTNAMAHRGYKYTLSFDLEDFFGSVTWEMVSFQLLATYGKEMLSKFAICFPDGRAHQGLSTSPALANIAAEPIDKDIVELIRKPRKRGRAFEGSKGISRQCVYTRYADDLTFSFDSVLWFDVLRKEIPEIVERHGFKLNHAKTTAQSAKAGRRMITGVAVLGTIRPPRAMRRRLRAAKHQRHTAEARGLAEWCKLKPPKGWLGNQPLTVIDPKAAAVSTAPKPTTGKTINNLVVPILKRIINLD